MPNHPAARVRQARQALARFHAEVDAFHADPITQAYGCAADFAPDQDARERELLSELLHAARAAGDRAAEREALDAFEQWMP